MCLWTYRWPKALTITSKSRKHAATRCIFLLILRNYNLFLLFGVRKPDLLNSALNCEPTLHHKPPSPKAWCTLVDFQIDFQILLFVHRRSETWWWCEKLKLIHSLNWKLTPIVMMSKSKVKICPITSSVQPLSKTYQLPKLLSSSCTLLIMRCPTAVEHSVWTVWWWVHELLDWYTDNSIYDLHRSQSPGADMGMTCWLYFWAAVMSIFKGKHCVEHGLHIRMDNSSPLPPSIHKQCQNVPDTNAAILRPKTSFGARFWAVAIWGWICGTEVLRIHTLCQSQGSLNCQSLKEHLSMHQRDENSMSMSHPLTCSSATRGQSRCFWLHFSRAVHSHMQSLRGNVMDLKKVEFCFSLKLNSYCFSERPVCSFIASSASLYHRFGRCTYYITELPVLPHQNHCHLTTTWTVA